jgi:hypothetical protein
MLIDAPTPQGGTERREHDNESKPEQPGVVVQDEGEPDGSNARTPEAEQREKEDLIAQQVMAEAALQMLKLTQWQIYLGIVGAILLLAALIYTARATRAAIKANEITRAAFIADQRPWLNVSLVIDSDLTLYEDVAILDVSVTIQNIGKSPATDIAVGLRLVNTGNRWMGDEVEKYSALDILTQNRDIVDHQGHSLFPGERMTICRHLDTGTKRERITLTDNRPYVFLSVIVTVTYSFEFQEREPITAVAYRLIKPDRSDGRHIADFFLDEEKVPRDVLRLEPSFGSLIR